MNFFSHRDRKRSTERNIKAQADDLTSAPTHQREYLVNLIYYFSPCVSLRALCEMDRVSFGVKLLAVSMQLRGKRQVVRALSAQLSTLN